MYTCRARVREPRCFRGAARNALYLRRILITFILSSENLFPAKKKRGVREEWTCPLAFPGCLGEGGGWSSRWWVEAAAGGPVRKGVEMAS